jgi:hypothetical protein
MSPKKIIVKNTNITIPTIYGYLRVFTDKQDLDNNKKEIICKARELGF